MSKVLQSRVESSSLHSTSRITELTYGVGDGEGTKVGAEGAGEGTKVGIGEGTTVDGEATESSNFLPHILSKFRIVPSAVCL